jgi:ABC-type polysaccharide/polyol phosphate export permease
VLVRLLAGFAETTVFLALAIAFGLQIHYTPDLAWILPLVTIALLTGTSFGFVIAGLATNPEAANQLNIALFTPVFLLAGVQYPLQGLPGALPTLAKYLIPFAAPIQGFREAVAGSIGSDFTYLKLASLAWLAAALALAVRSYRYDERAA